MAIETKKKKSKKLQIRAIGGKPLPDELLKPIARPPSPNMLLRVPDEESNKDMLLLREQIEKVKILTRFLGFDPQKDGNAAYGWAFFEIATEFIPGFQLERLRAKRGRKTKWSIDRYQKLMTDADEIRRKLKYPTNTNVCDYLLSKPPYKEHWKETRKVLQNRLRDAATALAEYEEAKRADERWKSMLKSFFDQKAK